jgi:hypothetical protein
VSEVVYDAAVLVAADRNERRVWAENKVRLEFGVLPLVAAPVFAQVSRSPQQLRRFLAGCAVVPLGEREAHEAGRLLGKTRTADIVDAVVVAIGDCGGLRLRRATSLMARPGCRLRDERRARRPDRRVHPGRRGHRREYRGLRLH